MPIEKRGRSTCISVLGRCSPKRALRFAGATYAVLVLCLLARQWHFRRQHLQNRADDESNSGSSGSSSVPLRRYYDYNPLRKLFYIHPLDNETVDLWPHAYTHSRLSTNESFKDNYGAGELLNQREGRYRTHQYSLFRIFYYRLLESPYITDDPDRASLFFIPYDIGMDGSTRQSDGALVRTNCPRLDAVMSSLQSSRHFIRSGGSDHFMIHSINHMMLHFLPRKTCRRLYDLCLNCTKLSIDVYDSSVYQRELQGQRNPLSHRWHSVPFPSDYHYSRFVTSAPWDASAEQSPARRPYALAFVGSDQVTAKYQKELRLAIMDHCRLQRDVCLLRQLQTHDSLTPTSPDAYRQSRLCLMPGGDFLARKAFFDALLAGCVPVLFHRWSAHEQWTWSWGSAGAADDALLLVDSQQLLLEPQRTFSQLLSMSANATLLEGKLRAARAVAHRMQYNLPSGGDRRASGLGLGRLPNDAVDVALEHLFSTGG